MMDKPMCEISSFRKLENEEWPENEIESLTACPVCLSKKFSLMHSGLQDRIFCAPGIWTLYDCLGCGNAFLNPRPTQESMYLAYQKYYTHQQSERLHVAQLKGFRRLQRLLANGYKNWRFGTNLQPSRIFGVPVTFFMPAIRATLNRQFRHLPPLPSGGCLLDVGFGDGSFLENAMSIGWNVQGIDPDIETVKNARARGLNVQQGSLEKFVNIKDKFDVITMCHVIEHMHDPVASLRACYRLLKPGGQLWLETPNIKSLGYSLFKESWRGLEPPRHLVIFNTQSLIKTLVEVGFFEVKDIPQASPCDGVFSQSQRIAKGLDPNINASISLRLRVTIVAAKFVEMLFGSRREFIALKAIKFKE